MLKTVLPVLAHLWRRRRKPPGSPSPG